MICVFIDPARLALRVNGHAGFASAGHDVVCAGASMLAGTLMERLRELGAEQDMKKACLENGYCDIELRQDCAQAEEYRAVFEVIAAGFTLLERTYPQYVAAVQKL